MNIKNRLALAAIAIAAALLLGDIAQAGTQWGIVMSIALVAAPTLRQLFAVDGVGFAVADIGEQIEEISKKMGDSLKEVKGKQDELSTYHNQLKADIEAGKKSSDELIRKTDDGIQKVNELKQVVAKHDDRLQELTQEIEAKLAKIKSETPNQVKSYGQQLVEEKGYDEFMRDRDWRGQRRFSLKAIYRAQAGGLNREPYQDSLVSLERRELTVRDLLTVIPVDTDAVKYARQTVRTNNAAPVAESAAKPYSQYEWGEATATIKTLAHLTKLSRQAVMNAPRLQAEVDSEMRYGLDFVEEQQLLYGTGVGENILGIMPQATAFALPGGVALPAGATNIDVIRLAMLQNALSMAPADGVVLNPIDWTLIELLKDGNNAYLFANVQGGVSKRIWALPVVDTVAMTQGDFLVGAFKYGANMFERLGTEVLLSTENADDFEKNLMTMRAEKMIGLGVKRTYAFTKGTFSDITTP